MFIPILILIASVVELQLPIGKYKFILRTLQTQVKPQPDPEPTYSHYSAQTTNTTSSAFLYPEPISSPLKIPSLPP